MFENNCIYLSLISTYFPSQTLKLNIIVRYYVNYEFKL